MPNNFVRVGRLGWVIQCRICPPPKEGEIWMQGSHLLRVWCDSYSSWTQISMWDPHGCAGEVAADVCANLFPGLKTGCGFVTGDEAMDNDAEVAQSVELKSEPKYSAARRLLCSRGVAWGGEERGLGWTPTQVCWAQGRAVARSQCEESHTPHIVFAVP